MADIHVYPVDDAIDHNTESRACWCRPDIDQPVDAIDAVVVHHSADGRERQEPGARPPATRH